MSNLNGSITTKVHFFACTVIFSDQIQFCALIAVHWWENCSFWHVFASWQRRKRCKNHVIYSLEGSVLLICASLSLTFQMAQRKSHTQASCVWSRKVSLSHRKGKERLGTILQSTMRFSQACCGGLKEKEREAWLSSKHIVCASEINFTFIPVWGSKVKLNKGQTHEIFP